MESNYGLDFSKGVLMETEEDYPVLRQERIRAARAYAERKLGDPSWADNILWAYENPRETIDYLERKDAESSQR